MSLFLWVDVFPETALLGCTSIELPHHRAVLTVPPTINAAPAARIIGGDAASIIPGDKDTRVAMVAEVVRAACVAGAAAGTCDAPDTGVVAGGTDGGRVEREPSGIHVDRNSGL